MFQLNKNSMLVVLAVLAIVITAGLLFINANPGAVSVFSNFGMSNEAVAKNAVEYISQKLLQPGQTASLESFSQESGLIKMKINVDGKSYNSYVTKDGRLLFPVDAIKIEEASDENEQAEAGQPTPTKAAASLTKADKPMLEAYVVSRCPFGLQIQRAMYDAVKNIPALAENLMVRYIGTIANGKVTAMHGDAEAQENLRQICIRDEQRSKYWAYVSCQMQKGDTAGCQTSANINTSKLNGCISNPDRGVAYAKEDFDLTAKYGIEGSPTVILNGQRVSEFDFGGRSSDAMKTLVCNASNTQAEFCLTTLNTQQAATSFSVAYAGAEGSAPAANSANTNCAPAN